MMAKKKKIGIKEGLVAAAVEAEVTVDERPEVPGAEATADDVLEVSTMRRDWPRRWEEFARRIRADGLDCDLRSFLFWGAELFEVEFLGWLAGDFPAGSYAGRHFVKFVEDVEADLALESMEPGPNGLPPEPATVWEFIEAIARRIDTVLATTLLLWSANSPHETVTGISKPTTIIHVLSPFALTLRRLAQWSGEGVSRAGEKIPSPVHDPNWRPSGGPWPWSM